MHQNPAMTAVMISANPIEKNNDGPCMNDALTITGSIAAVRTPA